MIIAIICPHFYFYNILKLPNYLFFVVNSIEKTYICNVKDFIQYGKRKTG